AADAEGPRSRGAPGGNCFTWQTAGGRTAALWSKRRGSGDRSLGSGTDRLDARRPALVSVFDGTTQLPAPHSVAVRGKSRVRPGNVPAVFPAHSGAVRSEPDRGLFADITA